MLFRMSLLHKYTCILHNDLVFTFPQATDWLSQAEREQFLLELKATGWVEVDDRDALYKELHFKTFNQVCNRFLTHKNTFLGGLKLLLVLIQV